MLRSPMLAGVVLMCGCGQQTPQPPSLPTQETNTPAAPAETQDEPKPVAPALAVILPEALPPASENGVTMDAWGPIRIGMTLDALNAALGTNISVADDVDYGEYGCTWLDLPGDTDRPGVMFVDGKVARFSLHEGSASTYAGLKLGDSAALVREAFGSALNEQPHFYRGRPSQYLTVWMGAAPPFADEAAREAARGLRFETDDDGAIIAIHAGDGSVEWVEGCL
ncbi:MAG: hypothetical protein R3C46_14320 [Hyphomonadaceae bacterium]